MSSTAQIEVFQEIGCFRQWRRTLSSADGRPLLGFVPTMGALHQGHVTLINKARSECQKLVVSIFVNPLQFGANEDFGKYPRTWENDLQLCQQAGVDAVLHPLVEEIYPRSLEAMTKVIPPDVLINRLCGIYRPGHFEGVATVVSKLFGIVEPTNSYFGEKDYQQLTIIRRMVADLNLPTAVVGVPTVRESDGLALSSRNVYLSKEERQLAPRLHTAIVGVADESLSGRLGLADALTRARASVTAIPGVELQYLEACDVDTLQPLEQARRPMVVLVAAKLGAVRLIDNVVAGA